MLDQLPVKLPEFEEAALQTLVVQRVHLKTGFYYPYYLNRPFKKGAQPLATIITE